MNGEGTPAIPRECRRILDVGCGDGGALEQSAPDGKTFVVATDISLEALRACRDKFPSAHYVRSSAEHLPYRANAFDAYIARSSWPYTDLPKTTQEAFRVLANGGFLWASTRTGRTALGWLAASFRSRYAHGVVFHFYVLCNGLALHLTGRNFKFPFQWSGMSRYESFHSRRSIRSLLRRAGFDQIVTIKRHFLEVTARKSAGTHDKAPDKA